jgi:hypothetical protein
MDKKIWPPASPVLVFSNWESKKIDIAIVRKLLEDWYQRNITALPGMDAADAVLQAGLLLHMQGATAVAIIVNPEFFEQVEATLLDMVQLDGAGNILLGTSLGRITLIKQRLG